MALSDLRVQTYGFPGFKGLNLKDGPLTVPPQFAREANFIDFSILGAISKSKAPTKWNTGQITSYPAVLACAWYRQNGGSEFFIVYTDNGKFYKISAAGTVTDITPGTVTIATGAYGHFFNYNNLLWFSDGSSPPIYVHDTVGSGTWFEIGLSEPPAAPTHTLVAGSLSGTYYYKYVFVSDTGAVSNPSPASAVASPATNAVRLTVPVGVDSAENQEKRWIYRTANGDSADGIYYFLYEIPNNTTTQYDDDIPDSSLGDRLLEEQDKPASGAWGFTEYHGSVYAFVPGTHNLLYSNLGDPEAWGPFNTEPITPGDGYPITGLGKLKDLAVFKEKGIHNWLGYPGLFRRDQKVEGVGCVSHRSISNVDLPSGGEVLFFLSRYGPRFYDGQDEFLISRELEPIFTGTDPDHIFNHTRANQSSAVFDVATRRYMLSIPVNGSADNNLMLIYDAYANSWARRDPLYAGSIAINRDSADKDQVIIGESRSDSVNGGWVSILEDDNDYYGADYVGEYITAWNHFGFPNHVKHLRYIEVDARSQGSYNLMIDIYVDGSSTPILTVPMSLSESGYDWDASDAIWDTATWAKDDFLTVLKSLKKVQGRYISIGLKTETVDRPFEVYSVRIQYQLLPNAGERR